MNLLKNVRGYSPRFLRTSTPIPLPELSPKLLKKVAPLKRSRNHVLKYLHFSVIQHAERKLPLLTASNMDGKTFRKIPRREIGDRWLKDPRMDPKYQLGMELYRAKKSDFDRGHMIKREDVQWGRNGGIAKRAAASTFFFTNAAPQHKDLNRAIWREIEDYILHDETVSHGLKINSFTGPIFREEDPLFVTKVKGEDIKLPTLFWKVIFYKRNKQLFRIAFLVGQDKLLKKHDIVKKSSTRGIGLGEDDPFSDFGKADTYQVDVSLIEELTDITFPKAWDVFHDDRPRKLILEEVNVRSILSKPPQITNLVL